MIDRRRFVAALAGGFAAASLVRKVEAAGRIWRIGYLTPTRKSATARLQAPLTKALRELGYVEGENLAFEARAAEDDVDRLAGLAAELARSRVDLIVAIGPPAIRAAAQATKTIPIVMAFWGGPGLIESGTIASFARPGTNVTGIYMLASELEEKRLQLLVQAVPGARRIAVLNPGAEQTERLAELRGVADAAGIDLRMSAVADSNHYVPVFEALARDQVGAVLVPSFPRFYLEHQDIIEAAAKAHVPAMYEWGEMARDGGLIAYGPDFIELHRRVAFYIEQVLKGTKPAELPVEQPTKFELVINLGTARALGLRIPQALLLRADEVIA